MWNRVIKDPSHGQLIEINTWGLAAAEGNRFAGITQVVGNLHPGATYEFSLYGLMREEAAHPGEDPYRYRVQWGYAVADGDPSESDITNWVELPWNDIYLRTDPGPMLAYATRFQAPGQQIIVGIRAWKKWGTVQRELDVNLDAIRLVSCAGGVKPWPDGGGGRGPGCVYIVMRGDTLGRIAARNHTSVQTLAGLNRIANPNVIYVGQRLVLPCGDGAAPVGGDPAPAPAPQRPVVVVVTKPSELQPLPAPDGQSCSAWHVVMKGDTLGRLASRYSSSAAAIAARNRLANPNVIYVGQKLCIPAH
jgi:LysM repeat protein